MNRRDAENAEEYLNSVTDQIIGAAIEVHRTVGPGLLESAYEQCLCHELALRGIPFQRQLALPLAYKGVKLDCGYRLDLVVDDAIAAELKAVDHMEPVHTAQMLTYLRLGGWSVGLLINFNRGVLKDGIKGIVNNFPEVSASSASRR